MAMFFASLPRRAMMASLTCRGRVPAGHFDEVSREVSVRGRRHVNQAEIINQKGEVLARSRGLFVAIDPHRMFAKFVER